MMQRNVGVVFGGVSPEHEVSIISALQAAAALDRARYRPVPIYIAKDGVWYTGDDRLLDPATYRDLERLRREATPVMLDPCSYRTLELVAAGSGRFARPARWSVDVLLLGLHGGPGENGGLQGLCEAFNVPYTGSGILGSALGMDKVLSKMLCRDQQIPVVDFLAFRESDWGYHEEAWLDRCEQELGYPVVVKPARLGSSIGISRAADRAALDAAIEEALRYDEKVVVERAVTALREINCSVLGDVHEAIPSVLEEPVRSAGQELLSFREKYLRGGGADGGKHARRPAKQPAGAEGMASLDRVIPAPLPPEKTAEIQALGVRIFQLFECSGVARIDFLMDGTTGQVYFNEINTIPGSFSFYLWEPTGVSFTDLTHRLIDLALKQHHDKNGRVRTYDVNLLSERSLQGLKGAKQRAG
ncbi:MAG: D-alanine--D-alanine ligase [Bacteroidetes bacterium]|nr:MAG: D-alanine--D-alanine ligase [Bacteroidota bacterium]